ncbi:hypothetical protein IFM89_020821 [Coptis chinensis]|uniref:Uncharacterized protein n=1 Tax=Coptis chinensis TaxID=261450 RepID=A0A835IU94_9MAGN|nr:hypothetical protein IFM89_020821 [Coptis chinensis]
MAVSSRLTTPHFSLTLNFSKLHKHPSLHINITPSLHLKKIFCCLSSPLDQTDKNSSIPTNQTNSLRIIFAAGGTGGHMYPAVAIADELKNIDPSTQILFLGTQDGMESTAIPSSGYDFDTIQAFPLIRPLYSPQNILFPFYLIKSMIYSWEKLRDFEPHVVLGTGGYVSAPGIANWVLSFFADMVFVAFPSSVKYFPEGKCIVSGNPIRLSMRQYVSKTVAGFHFFPRAKKNWDSESKVVLILGGSLGANAINIAILNMYYEMLVEHKNWFIIWQTGVEAFNEMESLVKHHSRLVLTPFSDTMDLAYAAADLVVSRAGAMTCSEILATGKPSILIPSPNVAEGHQMKNASIMSDLAGSKVVTEDELESTTLRIAIEEILGDERQMADMSEKGMKAARPEASAEIAKHIFSLVELSAVKSRI